MHSKQNTRPRCLISIPIQLVRTRIDLDLEPETVPRNITGLLKSPQLTPQYDGLWLASFK